MGQLPSQVFRVPPLRNDLAAYQFDNAVIYFGLVIENAVQEREEYGPMNARQSRQKYSMDLLLDPEFRLPSSGSTLTGGTSQRGLREMAVAFPDAVGRWKAA